jgi:hypothetical protein
MTMHLSCPSRAELETTLPQAFVRQSDSWEGPLESKFTLGLQSKIDG